LEPLRSPPAGLLRVAVTFCTPTQRFSGRSSAAGVAAGSSFAGRVRVEEGEGAECDAGELSKRGWSSVCCLKVGVGQDVRVCVETLDGRWAWGGAGPRGAGEGAEEGCEAHTVLLARGARREGALERASGGWGGVSHWRGEEEEEEGAGGGAWEAVAPDAEDGGLWSGGARRLGSDGPEGSARESRSQGERFERLFASPLGGGAGGAADGAGAAGGSFAELAQRAGAALALGFSTLAPARAPAPAGAGAPPHTPPHTPPRAAAPPPLLPPPPAAGSALLIPTAALAAPPAPAAAALLSPPPPAAQAGPQRFWSHRGVHSASGNERHGGGGKARAAWLQARTFAPVQVVCRHRPPATARPAPPRPLAPTLSGPPPVRA
jgi:hypothetical protein